MRQTLQHIIFPDDETLYDYWGMFYRGSRGILTEATSDGYLCLNKFENVEFCTYLNGMSYEKWKNYTNIKNVILKLDIEGEFQINLCGYSLEYHVPVRKKIASQYVVNNNRSVFEITFPENSEQMLYFEIRTFGEVKIYGGSYEGVFDEKDVRDIELALSTTTCWKEEYIKKNVRRIKKSLLDIEVEISHHFKIHIVDNGRTLKTEDFPEDDRIFLHLNNNTGGSGGYARGMIECKHQTPKPTHVLLMDDDVMILPDSIFRTYALLKTVKMEYQDYFIGGAMLDLDEMNIQFEDIGTVDNAGNFAPLKPRWNHFSLRDNLFNEKEYTRKNTYQAWWYCCIPMKTIEEKGLPLPLFIRGDDSEYSLRCGANILTLNAICVWHMGFYGKYSAAMNIYQECRNLLIGQATTGVFTEVDLLKRVKRFYRDNVLKHDYNAAELALKALEDFMKGPEFISQDLGEVIVKENSKLNQKMKPLKDFQDLGIDLYVDPYFDFPRKFLKKWVYRITYNGHRLFPQSWLDKTPVVIPFDFGYTPSKMAMKTTYLAVEPSQKIGCLKEINKRRFGELQKRYKKDMKNYCKNKEAIVKRYKEQRDIITSEEFWKKYLDI